MKKVLFLCSGNYYRSRFAEALFNALALRWGLPWRSDSAGLALEWGVNNVGLISAAAAARLAELAVPPESYLRSPRSVTEQDLRGADLVIALKEAEHRPLLEKKHPAWAARVEYWHIHDDYDAPPEVALPVLESAVEALVARLREQGRIAG